MTMKITWRISSLPSGSSDRELPSAAEAGISAPPAGWITAEAHARRSRPVRMGAARGCRSTRELYPPR